MLVTFYANNICFHSIFILLNLSWRNRGFMPLEEGESWFFCFSGSLSVGFKGKSNDSCVLWRSSTVITGILDLKCPVSLRRLQESSLVFCSFLQQVWSRAKNVSKDKTCFWFSCYNKFQTPAHHFEVIIITYYTWFTVILVITFRPVSCLTASQHLHFTNSCSTYHWKSPALDNGTSVSLWHHVTTSLKETYYQVRPLCVTVLTLRTLWSAQSITMISQKYSFTRCQSYAVTIIRPSWF